MKIVIAEPLGIERERIIETKNAYLPGKDIELVIAETPPAEEEEWLGRCRDADIVVEVNHRLDRGFFAACGKLRLVAAAFAGTDHIDRTAAAEAGVAVRNCPGYSAAAVAELVFGLITAVKRQIIPMDGAVRRGGTRGAFVGTEIGGKHFGVVGYGHIGKRAAALAKAYGCKVYAATRHPGGDDGVTFVTLEELLAVCDIVSLHLPLTDESRGLIDGEKLALMKEGAILINTARGAIVDSAALADAVESGRLAGAAVDVFETEPPIDANHPLLRAGKIVATPHIGFATKEAFETRLTMTFQNIAAFLGGE